MSHVSAARSPDDGTHHVSMPTGTLHVSVERSSFPLDMLLGFAARANAKRGFLFLSKVLGKHWPVRPSVMAEVQDCLARQVPVMPGGATVFIGLAETAVGLGQGVFEAWCRLHADRAALFLHTTRYRVGAGELIEFEEAHSHAPRQFLHMPADPSLRQRLLGATSLVLVDDEASTGNTFVNLIEACRTLNPALRQVHLATITNFMGPEACAALSARVGLPVSAGAALDGSYHFEANAMAPTVAPAQRYDATADRGAATCFGRCGIDGIMPLPEAVLASLAAEIRSGESVLLLGTGEFMHPAFRLAQALEWHGADVVVQSTTRSPILQWGAVSHVLSFPDNYGEGIANFVYNVVPGQYDHVFICHETPPNAALVQLAAMLDGRLIHLDAESIHP